MKTFYKQVLMAMLLLVAVAFGEVAQATTKTVIYRISSANYNQNYHCYEVGFSRAEGSDMPFDGYENLYWMNIDESSLNIGSGSNGAGDYTVNFSDGFSLRLQWEAGSNTTISDQGGININAPSIDKYITYTVTGGSGRYFVTKIEMLNNEGNTGMSDINHHPMNPSFDYAYQLQESFNSRGSFGRIAITYTDAAPITLLTSPSANTYNITSKRDLAVLASYVNVSRNHCINLTFLQTQDIICDDTYVPVGYYNNEDDFACFSGTYDGQGRYIRNITVNRTGNTDADSSVGLFGCISAGTVQNVILAYSTFTGYNYVGGIVGFSNGNASGFTTVQNCRVDNSVVIKAGHDNASYHGGVVGYNYTSDAKVIGCFSGAAVSNNGKSGCKYFGGIVGKNDEGTIENCLYTGSIVTGNDKTGAIAGYNAGTNLSNNYYNNINLGGVNGSDVDGARRARTVNLGEDVVIVGDPTVYNVSAITAIGTGNYAMRRGNNPIFSGATQTLTLDYTGTAPDGYAFAGFSVKDSNNNDVAVTETSGIYTFIMPDKDVTVTAIIEIAPWSGDGTAEHPFLIRTTLDLDRLATKVNEGNDYSDKFFLQTADLVYDGTENNYVPIGRQLENTFNGVYDGGGHTISGIWLNYTGMSGTDQVGLFGHIGYQIDTYKATVMNIVLTDCTFSGAANVGGIVGFNLGTIRNCRVESSVNIYAGGYVSPRHGGIAGYNMGAVIGCVSAATVIEHSVESTDSRLYGGIAGANYGNPNTNNNTVRDCLYTGAAVESDQIYGAIIGASNKNAFLTNNYYNTTSATVPLAVNGRDTIGGRPARTITLGEGVILKGEETIYNVSGITAIGSGNHAIKYNDGTTTYIYSSVGYTVTLGAQEGYKLTSATLSYGGNDYNIEPDNGVFSFVMPDANVTVGATVEPGTPPAVNYVLFSGDLVEGDYLIVYDGVAMNNNLMNKKLQYNNVTAIDNVITTDQTDIVWHIAPSGDRWTIYNAEVNKYAAYKWNFNVDLFDNAKDGALWRVEGTSLYSFIYDSGIRPYLINHRTYGQNMGFDCSDTSDGGTFSLYKKVEFPQTVTLDIAHYTPDESDGWNLIASPLANAVFPTEVTNLTKNTYDLYRFNQNADAEWENWKADGTDHYHFDLEPGRGYLYANSGDVTLTFNGEHYNGDGTVTLTKTADADYEGWNLVGNPFAETAYIDRDFYVMNDDGSEIVLAERADYHVEAMEGIFVHADEDGETLTFTTEAPGKGSGQKSESGQVVINLSKGNRGSVIDRAIVRFDSKKTMEKLQVFDGSTKLYVPQDGKDYAMVSSSRQGEIPLNFKAKEMGQYTISVETFPETSLLDIKLIDRLEDVVVDLTENNRYTFIGSPTDRQERFIIVFAETQNFASLQGHFAYQNGAEIIITGEGELQIFDVMGRMIASRRVNGVETFPETSLQTGVYILKLNEQTQKIVVR